MREKMLNITASAKKYLNRKRIEKNKKYILLDLKPSGCAGFEYTWDYCDELPLTFTLSFQLKMLIKADFKMQMCSTSCSTDFNRSVLLPGGQRILTDILLKFS